MKTLAVLGFSMFMLLSCENQPAPEEPLAQRRFRIPVVVNSYGGDSIEKTDSPFVSHAIESGFPEFAGKFSFSDTINIAPKQLDSAMQADYLDRDTQPYEHDTFGITGFEMIIDPETTVPYCSYRGCVNAYYPIYFVNETNSDKVFIGKDSYVHGIHEAVNREGPMRWCPIERRGSDFCGNGKWALIVHPGEFAVVLMKKYEGSLETQMRARIVLGENHYVSKTFTGTINPGQFYEEEGLPIQEILTNEYGPQWIVNAYYGTMPMIKDE